MIIPWTMLVLFFSFCYFFLVLIFSSVLDSSDFLIGVNWIGGCFFFFFHLFIYFILIQCCVIWSKFKPVRNLHMISYKIPKPLPSNRIFKYILSRFPFGIPYYHYSIVAVPTISNKCSRPSFNLKLLLFA